MNSISKLQADAKARILALVAALCMLTLTVRTQDRPIATAMCAGVHKLQQARHDADELLQLSRRMYRFYKLSQETSSPQMPVH